jgi:hypothetical protein
MAARKRKENAELRSNEDLENMMYSLWEEHFADVPRMNLVLIHFGKRSKRQLGCIRWVHGSSKVKGLYMSKKDEHDYQDDKRISQITITGHFIDKNIPDNVVEMVIAHEMVHYTHGFHSPLPKLYDHPHRGNIVNKELIKRGLGDKLESSELWIKDNWVNYLRANKGL